MTDIKYEKIYKTYKMFRWFVWCFIYIFFAWQLHLHPNATLEKVPLLWKTTTHTIKEYLPIAPEKLSDAFKIGEMNGRYLATDNTSDKKKILQEATTLLDLKDLMTQEQFLNILSEINSIQDQISITQKV